jgi:hypothetical protein
MVDLLVEGARNLAHFKQIAKKLPNRLEKMRCEAAIKLNLTKKAPK